MIPCAVEPRTMRGLLYGCSSVFARRPKYTGRDYCITSLLRSHVDIKYEQRPDLFYYGCPRCV